MPLYEYVCEADGTVIELQRPMADADKPVQDPTGKGRTFKRKFSTFSTGGAASTAARSTPLPTACCPCGKPNSACNMN